ncbi:methyl-accepting chemotaxis protein [Treponema sp. R8-4-B8]
MKIKYKLSIMVIAIVVVVITGVAVLLLRQSTTISRTLSEQKIALLARQRAQYWNGRIGGYLQVLHAMAQVMCHFESTAPAERRDQYEKIMNSIFEEQPDMVRMFTVWKPNAIDGADSRYIGRTGSTVTGQFAYALGQETGKTVPQTSQVVDAVMEYVSGPNAKKDNVSHPSPMSLAGTDTYVVRLMVPIINTNGGEIVGAIGCQLNINLVQPRIEATIKEFEEVAAISIYSSNGFIIGSYRPERIGKMMNEAEVQFGSHINEAFEAVKNGKEYQCFSYAPTLKTNVEISLIPIPIGDSDTTWSVMIGSTEEYIMKEVREMIGFTVILSMIAIVIVTVIMYLVVSGTTKPIGYLAEAFLVVAKGDLTHVSNISSKDEIGDLAQDFNLTVEEIKTLVGTMKYKINALTNTGHELSANMDKTSKSVDQISENFDGMKVKMNAQEHSAAEAEKAVKTIKNSIDGLNMLIESQSESINNSSSAIEEMTANIHSVTKTLIENSKNVIELTEASENGKTGLQTVAQKILDIAHDSEGLLQINAVMNNIASQTNLLSMNAAIEAAHAGEIGRGFAVVAEEIRKLAETSGKQSKTTGAMLKKIKTSIDGITESSNEVLSRFVSIDSAVKTVSTHEENIRNAMEEQEVGGKQILDSMGKLKEISVSVKKGASDMSESGDQLNRQTGELIQSSNEVVNGMNDIVNGAMKEIKAAVVLVDEMSAENSRNFEELKTESKRFKVESGNEQKKVIIVDDDETVLTMTKAMLDKDYEVTTVSSGKAALDLFFKGYTPNLVLLDLSMPDMGGWDTYIRIRDLTRLHNVPITIYTASENPEDRAKARELGAVDYIIKPMKKTELLERVKKQIK